MKKTITYLFAFVLLCGLSLNLTAQDKPGTTNIKPVNITAQQSPAGSRCDLVCPPAGIPEGETCGGDINGGCNMVIPQFTLVTPNKVICGNAWYDGGTRDTDWFEIVLTQPEHVKMTVISEAQSTVIGMIAQIVPGVPGCANMFGSIDPYAIAPACQATSVEVDLGPGTYYFFVGLDFAGPVYLCADGGIDYQVTFNYGQNVPIAPWSIILGVMLIGVAIFFRYRK